MINLDIDDLMKLAGPENIASAIFNIAAYAKSEFNAVVASADGGPPQLYCAWCIKEIEALHNAHFYLNREKEGRNKCFYYIAGECPECGEINGLVVLPWGSTQALPF